MEVWHALTDWEEGSSLVFRGEWEGKAYEDKGTILEAIPGERPWPMRKGAGLWFLKI